MPQSHTIRLAILAALFPLAFAGQATAQQAAVGMADVPSHHWAHDTVSKSVSMGLFEGQPDGSFGGDQTVIRHEFAVVVARLIRTYSIIYGKPKPATVPAHTDINSHFWSYGGVMDTTRSGLTQGLPDHTFRGDRPLTRYRH
jgi:hypothetical protein